MLDFFERAGEAVGAGIAHALGNFSDGKVGVPHQAFGLFQPQPCQVVQEGIVSIFLEKDGKVIGRQVEPVGHTGQGEIHITVIFLHIDLNFLDELGSGAGAVLLHIVAQLADESLEEFFQLVDVPALEDLL